MKNLMLKLVELLSGPAVFIRCPSGSKRPLKPWGHLRLVDMTPAYLAGLEKNNIGVALGEPSNGLCALDADVDWLAIKVEELNPELKHTLQTRGARGKVFWFRCLGQYPQRVIILKDHYGNPVGEFRSTGGQSIIYGEHPSGIRYSFVNEQPAVLVPFESLRWPDEVKSPTKSTSVDCTHGTHGTHGTQGTKGPKGTDVVGASHPRGPSGQVTMAVPDEFSSSQFKTLDDVLKVSIPQAPHQNHHRLFLLARGIRTLEVALGRCYSREELKQSFLRWYALAKGKLRPGRSKDAYLVEFLEAYGDVEHPLGLTTIQLAWQLAHTKPLPPESSYFDSQELRLLVALCWHLQVKAGTQPFYLAARTCQRLFGHDTHSTAATWLKALRAAGIIVEETKGTLQNGASHYRYLGADAPTAPTKLAG